MKKTIITLLFCSILHVSFAKTPEALLPGSLTGRVVDEMGYVLPGATVQVEGTDFGAVSDINGFFRVTGLENGTYKVKVSFIGFNSEEQTVTITDNRTVPLDNIVLKEGILMDEVVVTAYNPQYRAMSRQRDNINITNVISADQVSRFPDSNIGDALKRIPGINVQYDQGEARFGHIRGTSPDLSSVTIDGTRVPSAEADVRSVQLDLIPADMIQTIEVNKVIMPEMDADAIGGTVNLVTKSQPVGQRITAMAGSGYNLISEKPTINLGLSYGNRFLKDKLGMVASISFQDNPLGSDNIEFTWGKDDNGKSYVTDYQVRQYFVQRQRQSYSLALDYVINPDHKIEFNGMYNKRYDWENRYRMRIRNISPEDDGTYKGRMERQVKFGTKDTRYTRLEDQQVMTFSLGGNHNFNKLEMDWKTNYSKASERRPDERYINYRTKYFTFDNDLSDPRKPMASGFKMKGNDFDINDYGNFGLNEITESLQYTYDEDLSGKLDFSLPFNTSGSWKNELKFGASLKLKTKRNDVNFYEYEPTGDYEDEFDALVANNLIDQTRSNYLAGDYAAGKFPDRKFFGDLQLDGNKNFEKSRIAEEDLDNFDAKERVIGSYLRYNQRLNGKVDLVLGLRMEHTTLSYNAFQWDQDNDVINPVKGDESSYYNLLPSIVAKWDVSKDLKLRAAWTNTLARPKYTDLTPRQSISFEKEEIEVGNPELEPTKSMNFDLMVEYYVNNGLISAGVFYKDIQNLIVDSRYDNYHYMNRTWKEYTQPINGGNADLLGFEVAMQQRLSFLPGFLRYFNVYANYTYNHSVVKDFNYEGRENEELSLPGTPAHTLNAALGFNNRKFSARLSYNYASDFIDELGKSAFFDVYYDKVNYLDFNCNLSVGKHTNIFANVNNILNQPLRYYQGSQEYTYQAEYYNFRFDAGVKFNF